MMKVWAQLFYGTNIGTERLGSDGVIILDARFAKRNWIIQCEEIAKRRGMKAFQIHRSSRFSNENPVTKIIEVNYRV